MGPDGIAGRDIQGTAVAYNSVADEYLVIWSGEGLDTDGEFEVFGQRLSATGGELGSDFRISNIGTEGQTTQGVLDEIDVAYNATANQYLVVWSGENAGPGDAEIYAQQLSAAGAQIPDTTDIPISSTTPAGEEREARAPSVTYNPTADEYLVVWSADDLATDNEFEIFGQRINADGSEDGTDDFRISNVGTDGETDLEALRPTVAYNPAANEYLVAWEGEATNNKPEIYGQRVTASGAQTPNDTDFRISTTGTDIETERNAQTPDAAYNPASNEYLVAWTADPPPLPDNKLEIHAQLLNATGADVGSDFRVSNNGADSDAGRDSEEPAVAYNPIANQYLVTWFGDGLATDGEFEIFGQLLGAAGAGVGSDFRISTTGTDGETDRGAFTPAVAAPSAANGYLVAWTADGLVTDDETEVFGQLLRDIPASAGGAGAAAAPSNAFTIGKLNGRTLTLFVSTPGTVKLSDATTAGKRVATVSAKVKLLKSSTASGGPGKIKLKVRLTAAAKKLLREKGKVKAKAKLTFTPTGGTPSSKTRKLKIKQ